MSQETKKLFAGKLKVINVGAEYFGDAIRQQGVEVEQVEWRPPAGGDKEMGDLLKKLGM